MTQRLLTLFLLLAVACASTVPMLQTSEVDLGPLIDEHDVFVEGDALLEDDARASALAQSALLDRLLQEHEHLELEVFRVSLSPVVDRYDAYLLAGWLSLSTFEQRYLTRTSDIARGLAGLEPTEWPLPIVR